MTALRAVCAITTIVVLVAIALVVAGVALLAGAGWALIVAGVLLGLSAVACTVVLLRDPGGKRT